MSPQRRNRLVLILAIVVGVTTATGFALYAFNQNMMFFFSPTEVLQGKAPQQHTFRVGGMVVNGSLAKDGQSTRVRFQVTDNVNNLGVQYQGILPDLFREGQGVVVRGRLNTAGQFIADEVLAKHDENYMPPEVAASLHPVADESTDSRVMP